MIQPAADALLGSSSHLSRVGLLPIDCLPTPIAVVEDIGKHISADLTANQSQRILNEYSCVAPHWLE